MAPTVGKRDRNLLAREFVRIRRMMQEHDEFEVETDRAGDLPMPFWSETVRRVLAE